MAYRIYGSLGMNWRDGEKIVKSLTEAGFLKRTKNQNRMNSNLIEMTDKGREFLKGAKPVMENLNCLS